MATHALDANVLSVLSIKASHRNEKDICMDYVFPWSFKSPYQIIRHFTDNKTVAALRSYHGYFVFSVSVLAVIKVYQSVNKGVKPK